MASFSHTISVPKAPGEVFPWLLEEDKVPQWTTRLQAYKVLGGGAIGHGSKIGANSVVIHDVPPNSTVVGVPGHPVRVEGVRPEGPDADWVHLPDPIADAIKVLSRRIADLERELAARDGKDDPQIGEVVPLRNVRGPNPAGG